MGRTVIAPPPRSIAQAFADYLNSVLNRTVSDARLTLLGLPGEPEHFTIAYLHDTRASSFALHGSSLRLLVAHTVEVVANHCHTVSYSYRLATGDDKEAWLLRWEYFARPPRPSYVYPLAHVHARAGFADTHAERLLAKPTPHLHIPTARVGLELVLWHLLAEWGVQSKAANWQRLLEESLAGFDHRRTAS